MTTYSECPTDFADAYSSDISSDWISLLSESGIGSGASGPYGVGRNASSSGAGSSEAAYLVDTLCIAIGTATSTASPSANVSRSAKSSAAALSHILSGRDGFLTSDGDGASDYAYLVDTNVVSSALAVATALRYASRTWNVPARLNTAEAVGSADLSLDVNQTSGGDASASTALETQAFLASDGSGAEVVTHSNVTAQLATGAASGMSAYQIGMIANTLLTSSAKAKSRAAPQTPEDASYALWANSKRMSSSLWNNVPFESYVLHEGRLIAAGDGGIYTFGADTDSGRPVIATIKSDLLDFQSEYKKCFEAVVVKGTLAGPLAVSITNDEDSGSSQTHLPSSSVAVAHRAPIGRGFVSLYARFTLENSVSGHRGSYFGINGVSVRVGETMRVR